MGWRSRLLRLAFHLFLEPLQGQTFIISPPTLSSCPHLIQSTGPASGHQSPDVASWGHLPFTPPTHSFPPSGPQGCFWGLPRMLIPGCSAHASPAWLPLCTRVSAHCYTFKISGGHNFGGHNSNQSIKIMP